MAKNAFTDWSTTAASNTDIGGIGIQGTDPPSNFDDALREGMAQLRAGVNPALTLSSKSAGYTALATDNNYVLRFTGAYTLSLTAAATLGANWHCIVMADGGAVTIDPNASETINGVATITIPDGTSTLVICDGTNFRATEDYAFVYPWVDVASATTTDIGAVASLNVRITGTTTITGLGTATSGLYRRVRFAGALTLTHNATSLIMPDGLSRTTVAGDIADFVSEGSGNWRCLSYTPANIPIGGSTPFVAYTPTFTGFGTVSSVSVFSRRVGDTLEVYGKFTAGTATATEARITLGFNGTNANVTSDATKNASVRLCGTWISSVSGAYVGTMLIEPSVGYLTLGLQNATFAGTSKGNGSDITASGRVMTFTAAVPISGW